jgi:Zn finger protein HypA/HybF involved in hydrogenase expression
MHEYGLAEDIAHHVREEAERFPGRQVAELEVEVGGMARLSADILSEWLQEALADLGAKERVKVSRGPVTASCPKCGSSRSIDVDEDDIPTLSIEYRRCPTCGADDVQLSGETNCRIRVLTLSN